MPLIDSVAVNDTLPSILVDKDAVSVLFNLRSMRLDNDAVSRFVKTLLPPSVIAPVTAKFYE